MNGIILEHLFLGLQEKIFDQNKLEEYFPDNSDISFDTQVTLENNIFVISTF